MEIYIRWQNHIFFLIIKDVNALSRNGFDYHLKACVKTAKGHAFCIALK